jgi:hypothetical protein
MHLKLFLGICGIQADLLVKISNGDLLDDVALLAVA